MRSRSNISSAASPPPFRPDAIASAAAVTTTAPMMTAPTGASTEPGALSARVATREAVRAGGGRAGRGAARRGRGC